MSTFYRIQIQKIKGNQVFAKIYVIHPDALAFPSLDNFALMMLVEGYRVMRDGYLFNSYENGLITRAAAREIAAAHPQKEILDQWVTLLNGETREITKEEYDALDRRDTGAINMLEKRLGGNLGSWSSRGNLNTGEFTYEVRLKPNYKKFVKLASEIILSVEQFNEKHLPYDSKKKRRPVTDFNFVVNDASLLAHLFPKMEWETGWNELYY